MAIDLSLRSRFALHRASNVLSKVRDVATALSFAGGRLTPLSALGIATHLAAFAVNLIGNDLADVASTWPAIKVDRSLHGVTRDLLARHVVRRDGAWMHCEVDGQAVLVHMDEGASSGSFFAERDPKAVIEWLRREIWASVGMRANLVPVGTWGDCIDLRASTPGPELDSQRAREVWARIEPMVRAGRVRSVLLDGPPRTGKSTVARRLIALAEEALGRPLRVLRIGVADFDYLRTSAIDGATAFLRPDVLVVDDLDRFGGSSSLLDLFEHVRQHVQLVITTSNDPTKLPLALRLPGRIDEVLDVVGAGPDLAASVLGDLWDRLTEPQREVVASWPVALIEDLGIRLTCIPGASAEAEIEALKKRAEEGQAAPKKAEAAATATGDPAVPE